MLELGLKEPYQTKDDVKAIVRCVLALLLPAADIPPALQDIRSEITVDTYMASHLLKLIAYMFRSNGWIDERSELHYDVEHRSNTDSINE